MREQIAGVENEGVRTYGKPSEQKTLYQECMLKRSCLKRSLNDAHEQRPGVHIQAV